MIPELKMHHVIMGFWNGRAYNFFCLRETLPARQRETFQCSAKLPEPEFFGDNLSLKRTPGIIMNRGRKALHCNYKTINHVPRAGMFDLTAS